MLRLSALVSPKPTGSCVHPTNENPKLCDIDVHALRSSQHAPRSNAARVYAAEHAMQRRGTPYASYSCPGAPGQAPSELTYHLCSVLHALSSTSATTHVPFVARMFIQTPWRNQPGTKHASMINLFPTGDTGLRVYDQAFLKTKTILWSSLNSLVPAGPMPTLTLQQVLMLVLMLLLTMLTGMLTQRLPASAHTKRTRPILVHTVLPEPSTVKHFGLHRTCTPTARS